MIPRRAVWMVYSLAFLVLSLLTLLVYVVMDASAFFIYGIAGENASLSSFPLYIILFAIPQSTSFYLSLPSLPSYILFILLVCIYSVMMLLTLFDGEKNIGEALRALLKGGVGEAFRNSFFSTASLSSAAFFASVLILSLQEKAGVPTGQLEYPNRLYELVSLSYSPLIEELGFRVSIIGTIAIYAYLTHAPRQESSRLSLGSVLVSLFYPQRLRETVGEGLPRRRLEVWFWVGVIISSIVFGSVHFLYGWIVGSVEWNVGKITQATMSGFVFGYLYIRFGLPASVISHWSFNYLIDAQLILQERYPIVVSTGYLIFTLGILTTIYLTKTLFGRLTSNSTTRSRNIDRSDGVSTNL